MAAAVVGDDAIAVTQEEQHLRVPVIRRQRPPMAEHDRLTLAPILVEELNAVFGRDRRHCIVSLLELVELLCAARCDANAAPRCSPGAQRFSDELPPHAGLSRPPEHRERQSMTLPMGSLKPSLGEPASRANESARCVKILIRRCFRKK